MWWRKTQVHFIRDVGNRRIGAALRPIPQFWWNVGANDLRTQLPKQSSGSATAQEFIGRPLKSLPD